MAIPLAETLITLGASLQPISSGATTSAGRQKKPWDRTEKSLVMGWVATGVAISGVSSVLTTAAGWVIMEGT